MTNRAQLASLVASGRLHPTEDRGDRVDDLTTAIRAYIDGWNTRCSPFAWTKPAEELVARATGGQRSSITRH